MLGGDIIIEGLISAEEIEKIFLSLLQFGLIKR
jgi:hypothetical protein